MDEHKQFIAEILEADAGSPRKHKHSAARIFQRLRDERGFRGGERTVRAFVAALKKTSKSVFIPLQYQPGGDAQVDYGEVSVILAGEQTKLQCFLMRLSFSRHVFVMFFPTGNQEAFLEGHVRAFEYFGGVPARLSYDNLKTAVTKVLKGKDRDLNADFLRLAGH